MTTAPATARYFDRFGVAASTRQPGHADDALIRRFADLRYAGQAYELTVPVPEGPLRGNSIASVVRSFEDEHLRTYGHSADGEPVDIVNIRVIGSARPRGSRMYTPDADSSVNHNGAGARAHTRAAYFGKDAGVLETPVISRTDLLHQRRQGPFIAEEYDATCVVPPGCAAALDAQGNIVIEVGVA